MTQKAGLLNEAKGSSYKFLLHVASGRTITYYLDVLSRKFVKENLISYKLDAQTNYEQSSKQSIGVAKDA